jgi:hypothetical protein
MAILDSTQAEAILLQRQYTNAHPKQLTVITPHALSGGSYRAITVLVMGDAPMDQVSGSGGQQVIDRPRRVAATQWYDRSPFQLTLNFIMDATVTSNTPISDMEQMQTWLDAATTSGTIIQPPYLTLTGPTPGTNRSWVLSTLTEKSRLYTPAGGQLQVVGTAVLYEFQPPYPYGSTSPAKNQQQTTNTKSHKTYIIKPGDTILKIAASQMGKASTVNEEAIRSANSALFGNIKITTNLGPFAGMVISIPAA